MNELYYKLIPMRSRSALSLASVSVSASCNDIDSVLNLCGCKSSARSSGVVISHSANTSGSVEHRERTRGSSSGVKTYLAKVLQKYSDGRA